MKVPRRDEGKEQLIETADRPVNHDFLRHSTTSERSITRQMQHSSILYDGLLLGPGHATGRLV